MCEKRGESMQTLVAYVENKPGVLNRVSSLARRLAINIDSLTVGPTENEEIARMTIVAHTDEDGAHRPHCHDARRRSAPATFARRREFYVRTGRFEREVEGSRSHVPVPEIGRRSGVPKHPAQVQHTPGRTTANDQQNERTSWRI